MNSRRSSRTHKYKRILIAIILGVVLIGVFKFIIPGIFHKTTGLKLATNRVNILLLGIGGGTHDGPNLTDTIIFASLDPLKNKVTLVSIPRDLWVPDLQGKINTAYAIGEQKQNGGGLLLAKAAVQKIVGQPIDYGVRVDFSGFVKAVDLLGGIDIDVERSFDDYEYPAEGKEDDPCGHSEDELLSLATASSQLDAFPCRYIHLHFNKGKQHMNGTTALRYVRSRHALGPEGTDFARSKRQQKVIEAVRNKVLSVDTFLNPSKMVSLYNVLKDSVDTDIKQEDYDGFIQLAQKMKQAKIQSMPIDEGDSAAGRVGLLTTPSSLDDYDNEWVLIPQAGNGDFSEIQSAVTCMTTGKQCPKISPVPTVSQK